MYLTTLFQGSLALDTRSIFLRHFMLFGMSELLRGVLGTQVLGFRHGDLLINDNDSNVLQKHCIQAIRRTHSRNWSTFFRKCA
ncbi:hypothetical protein JOS77_13285 [Chromobacterium haemolyticum]|nr:hypothetical protein JOS77_13285 [Chromobacterium haemolyticum]